jgi:hypothetical protein
MNLKVSSIALLLAVACYPLFSQELQKPSEGKSIIYFTRVSSAGALINFKFFDGEKYIGKFNGAKYMIYECDPGEHLFWASSENRDFMPAKIEAGKVYIVDARVQIGGIKARVDLMPLKNSDVKLLKKVNKLLSKKTAIEMDVNEIEREQTEMTEYIQISLDKYSDRVEKDKEYDMLEPEMAM